MKTALLIGMTLVASTTLWCFARSQRELASVLARAVLCEETAQRADRVILTCLSQQSIVKWELQTLGSVIRSQQPKDCK